MRVKAEKKAQLTPLPYGYDYLAPFMSEATVKEHHTKHQQAYVNEWNRLDALLDRTRGETDKGSMLRAVYESQTFNGAGVLLHELFWENLTKSQFSGQPSVNLMHCINRCFGSFQNMRNDIVSVGTNIQGSGWVIVAWVPRFDRLTILPVRQHQMNWIPGAVPIIVIDVWEHAYYTDYMSNRSTYLGLVLMHLNWSVINDRFNASR